MIYCVILLELLLLYVYHIYFLFKLYDNKKVCVYFFITRSYTLLLLYTTNHTRALRASL
jgi:hypothetical protein